MPACAELDRRRPAVLIGDSRIIRVRVPSPALFSLIKALNERDVECQDKVSH